jgi:hypothetical protein
MTTKQYYARTEIQHGEADGGLKVFAVGTQVSGLTKEAMVALWNAGVLTEVDPSARPADDRDDRIAQLEAQIAELTAKKTAAEAEPVVPPEVVAPAETPVANTKEAAVTLMGTVADPTREDKTDDGANTDAGTES